MLFFYFVLALFSVDNTIVYEYQEMSKHYRSSKDDIHHHLKGCRGVGKFKEYNCRFEQSLRGEEGYFSFIPRFDADIVISLVYIEFCE
jgi:hypothetical protein